MTTLPQVSSLRLPRASGPGQQSPQLPGGGGGPSHAASTAALQMTAADVWRVIRANMWLLISLVIIAAAIGYAVNSLLAWKAPKYTAIGIIQVQGSPVYDPLKQAAP